MEEHHVDVIGDELTSVLRFRPECIASELKSASVSAAAPKQQEPTATLSALFAAFKALSQQLQSLPDVPLKVLSVRPVHSAFRYSSAFPPQPVDASEVGSVS